MLSKTLLKIIQNTKNQENKTHSQKKRKSTVNHPKMIQMLKLIIKDFNMSMIIVEMGDCSYWLMS